MMFRGTLFHNGLITMMMTMMRKCSSKSVVVKMMYYSNYNDNNDDDDENVLEKFLETSMVVKMAPFSFLLALNFFKQSTVSCLKKFHREKEKGCNNFSLKYLGWNGCRPVEHAGHPLSLADPRVFQSLFKMIFRRRIALTNLISCPEQLNR